MTPHDELLAALEDALSRGATADVERLVEDLSFTASGLADVVARHAGSDDPRVVSAVARALVGAAVQTPAAAVQPLLLAVRAMKPAHARPRCALFSALQTLLASRSLRALDPTVDAFTRACLAGSLDEKITAVAFLTWAHAEGHLGSLGEARLAPLKAAVRALQPAEDARLALELDAADRLLG